MEYYTIKDRLSTADYNALVYLLRKFKKLTADLRLGGNVIKSNYGTFNFSEGFISVGNNWVLEDNVTVTADDVLKNTFYTFNFIVIDVNTSGFVNRRIVSVTGGTGENGELSLTIPSDIIGDNEVILPDYSVEVVFDEHEYYTPIPDINTTLTVDKISIVKDEIATVTGRLTDKKGNPLVNRGILVKINDLSVLKTTDANGSFSHKYIGTGNCEWVLVTVNDVIVKFFDGTPLVANVTGDSITVGFRGFRWLPSVGDVVIDWGDGSTDTVNNPTQAVSHSYSDGLNQHNIMFIGDITSLGDYCFYGCSGLTSIVIPESVTRLGAGCFQHCSGLASVTIPDSVTSLGRACFNGCSGLTSIVIPESVTHLGVSCFANCSGLASVTIPDSVTSLGDYCFYGCSGLTSIVIPESVTHLGVSCFAYCSGLASVTIPDSVTSLGRACFNGCSGLASVTIPDSVTILGDYCFANCSGLASVTIPDSVTSLGDYCFYGCSGLTSIVIPDSVTSLGTRCFYGYYSLINYDLYWVSNPVTYASQKMQVNKGTVFNIPYGTTQLYVTAGYPVERLVEREPTTDVDTVLSLLSDKQSIATDESLNLTGSLVDENGNPVKQASIKLFDGNTLIDTVTTDNLGAYTKTLNNLTKGSHTFHASFEGDSMYNASVSGDVSVTVSEHSYALVLSCSSPVIQKGGSASVVACLTRDGSVYTGQSLSYIVKHGSTIIDSGTLVTGSDGKATISYTGTGVGDVVFEVSYGSLLQETFVLEDCFKYDTTVHTRTTTSSSDLITPIYNDYSFVSDNFCAEFVWQGNGEGVGVGIAPKGRTTLYHHLFTACGTERLSTYLGNEISGEISGRWGSFQYNTDYRFKIEYMNGTVKYYINDELKITYSDKTYLNGETRDLYFLEWNKNLNIQVKDIKVKAL